MNFDKIKQWVQKNQIIAYPAIGVLAFILVSLLLTPSQDQKQKTSNPAKPNVEEIGLGVGGVDEKSDIARMKKDYFNLEDRLKEMEVFIKEMRNDQKAMKKQLSKVDDTFVAKIDSRIEELRQEINLNNSMQSSTTQEDLQLAIADIKPIEEKEDKDAVYLPLGSFCKGTLLTGVYAAADQNNPLPVLIALDEAFYGPNKSRIPLKGAFVMGNAYGDLVSERALIQIIAISSVLPDGVTFENEQHLGYVTDGFGELGIRGQVIYNTGRQLATTFMSGFLGGGAQALADQEVTTRQDEDGDTVKQVTGNGAKNAVFQGLAVSAGKMSDYYAKQMENLVPAIHVRNGQPVYFIVQKGVTIHGLSRLHLASSHISD